MKLKISVFFQSPANVFLFRHMSPRIAQSYLHAIGRLYYLVNRREKRVIENNVREHGEFQLTSTLDRLRQEDGFMGLVINGKRFDIGRPEEYLETLHAFRQ